MKLKEPISEITLSIEVYSDEKIIDVKDVERNNTSAVKVEFDEYKTDSLRDMNIIIHDLKIL